MIRPGHLRDQPSQGGGPMKLHCPYRVLSAVSPAEEPAPDRAKSADGAARAANPAHRSANADRVPQPRGGTHRQQTVRVWPDSLRPVSSGTSRGAYTTTKEEQHMNTGHRVVLYAALAAAVALTGRASFAQQATGSPGAPNATMTIDGKQLPPPPPKFGGVINERASASQPYWPPRVVPPQGAPNVLLIMTDDVGFGAPSTFGGVIPTPALDRIAQMGLRYTQFH